MHSVYTLVLALVFSASSLMAQDKIGSMNATQLNEVIQQVQTVEVLFFNESITLNISGDDAKRMVLHYEVGDVADFDPSLHKPLCELLFTSNDGLVLEAKVYYADNVAILLSKHKGVNYINKMSDYGKQFFAGIIQQIKQRKGN